MDYHAHTSTGTILIYSDAMPTDTPSVDAAILAGKPLVPKEACHYCGFKVPSKALWCCAGCASDYAARRKELAQQS
jgi:hypothetical protein